MIIWQNEQSCSIQVVKQQYWKSLQRPKLKPIYSFGKYMVKMKKKILFLNSYSCTNSKSPVNLFVWIKPSNFWENCIELIFSGCPPKFYHRVMYIAPSSGHISLNFNMPFKFILRRFEVVFWCLEWECCTFWKIDGNSLKSILLYRPMALIFSITTHICSLPFFPLSFESELKSVKS